MTDRAVAINVKILRDRTHRCSCGTEDDGEAVNEQQTLQLADGRETASFSMLSRQSQITGPREETSDLLNELPSRLCLCKSLDASE